MSEKQRKLKARKLTYKFGPKKLNILRPTEGYPEEKECAQLPKAKLELLRAHGYNGFNFNSRDNLLVSNCGTYLVYHIAALCVVYDVKKKKQYFFKGHNDDVTSICLDRRDGSTLVASGQTQPIDRPNQGKDLPKVWVWDLKTREKVELYNRVCWGYVSKVKWSPVSGYIYVIAGDDNHTLKAFDSSEFKDDYKKIEAASKEAKPAKKDPKAGKDKKKEECNFRPIIKCQTMQDTISGILMNHFLHSDKKPKAGNDDEKKEEPDAKPDKKDKKGDKKADKKGDKKKDDKKKGDGKKGGDKKKKGDGDKKKKKKDGDKKQIKDNENEKGESVDPNKIVDEMLIYGKRKFLYIEFKQTPYTATNKKINLVETSRSVSISKLNASGEKAFTAATFLHNGYYAVGCASGNIYICKSFDSVCLVKSCHKKPIGALCFKDNLLLSGGFDKQFKMWNVAKSFDDCNKKDGPKALTLEDSRYINVAGSDMVFQPKAICYNKKQKKIYIGVKSNQIVEVDEGNDLAASILVDGHDGEITSCAVHPELNLFITTGNDQSIKLWNAVKQKCIQTHEFMKDSDEKDDGRKGRKGKDSKAGGHAHSRSRSVSRGALKTGKEITKCCFSNDGTMIAFGTEDSRVCIVSFLEFLIEKDRFMKCEMYQIPTKSKASKESISYLRFSPCDSMLAVGHVVEKKLYMFHVTKQKMNKIKLDNWSPIQHHHSPMHIQWSTDGKLVKTVTRGFDVCHFEIDKDNKKSKLIADIPDPDEVKWFGNPAIAGWDVQGAYQSQQNWDQLDISDVTLNAKNKLLFSGDQFGMIRMHKYPAIDPKASIEFNGHSQNVNSLDLLKNRNELISCGGMDMGVFQWKLTMPKDKK